MSRFPSARVLGLFTGLYCALFFGIGQVMAAYDTYPTQATYWYVSNPVMQSFTASSSHLTGITYSLYNSTDTALQTIDFYICAGTPDALNTTGYNHECSNPGQSVVYHAVIIGPAQNTHSTTTLTVDLELQTGDPYYVAFARDPLLLAAPLYTHLGTKNETGCAYQWTGSAWACGGVDLALTLTWDGLPYSEDEVEIVELPDDNRQVQVGMWDLGFPVRQECLVGSSTQCVIRVNYAFDMIGQELGLYLESATTTDQWVDRIESLPDAYLLRADLHPVTRMSATVDTYQYLLTDRSGATTTRKSYGYTKIYWVDALTGGETGGYGNLWDYFENLFPLSLYYDLKNVTRHYDVATGSSLTLNLNDVLVDPVFTADAELLSVDKFRAALGDELYEKWMLLWEYLIHAAAFFLILWILWPETRAAAEPD